MDSPGSHHSGYYSDYTQGGDVVSPDSAFSTSDNNSEVDDIDFPTQQRRKQRSRVEQPKSFTSQDRELRQDPDYQALESSHANSLHHANSAERVVEDEGIDENNERTRTRTRRRDGSSSGTSQRPSGGGAEDRTQRHRVRRRDQGSTKGRMKQRFHQWQDDRARRKEDKRRSKRLSTLRRQRSTSLERPRRYSDGENGDGRSGDRSAGDRSAGDRSGGDYRGDGGDEEQEGEDKGKSGGGGDGRRSRSKRVKDKVKRYFDDRREKRREKKHEKQSKREDAGEENDSHRELTSKLKGKRKFRHKIRRWVQYRKERIEKKRATGREQETTPKSTPNMRPNESPRQHHTSPSRVPRSPQTPHSPHSPHSPRLADSDDGDGSSQRRQAHQNEVMSPFELNTPGSGYNTQRVRSQTFAPVDEKSGSAGLASSGFAATGIDSSVTSHLRPEPHPRTSYFISKRRTMGGEMNTEERNVPITRKKQERGEKRGLARAKAKWKQWRSERKAPKRDRRRSMSFDMAGGEAVGVFEVPKWAC